MKSTRWRRFAWSVFICLMPLQPVWAEIVLRLGDIQAEAWHAQGVQLSLADAESGHYALQLQVERLVLPDGEWRDVQLSCPGLLLTAGYHCEKAMLRVDGPYGVQQLSGRFDFQDGEHWQIDFSGLRLAEGRWRLQGRAEGAWQVHLSGKGAAVAQLSAFLPKELLPGWTWQGKLDADLMLHGQGAEPQRLGLNMALQQAGYASPDGLQALEGMVARLELDARRKGVNWQTKTSLSLPAGQWYSDPVFIDLGEQPLRIEASGQWRPAAATLGLQDFQATLGKLLTLTGKGEAWPVERAKGTLVLTAQDLAGLYPLLLRPLSYGTPLDKLDLGGALRGELSWQGQTLQRLSVSLQDVNLEDRAGRFGVEALSGDIHWQAGADGTVPASQLKWRGGHLYRIDFGASRADLALQGERVRLTEPLALPLLAGRLRVPRFELQGLGSDAPTWWAALEADELSLPALSTALNWPKLNGSLSVRIPAVSYASGDMGFDGELLVQAFDGTVRVNGLRLQQPFGAVPSLQAEASLRDLDLERLTRAFDMGNITGRLEGDVRGLQLVGWEPVHFSAELRTPPGDDSRHRISQRAVENLTALGNNGAVALSGTFLRFFESFAYDRLLLKVDLEGQQASLDGIPHQSGGYYLVKGSGLPRIDVIGRNRQVAWRDLVERLKRIRVGGMQMK